MPRGASTHAEFQDYAGKASVLEVCLRPDCNLHLECRVKCVDGPSALGCWWSLDVKNTEVPTEQAEVNIAAALMAVECVSDPRVDSASFGGLWR
jgi:hypothetical protein